MKIQVGNSYDMQVEQDARGKTRTVTRKAKVTEVRKKGRGYTIAYVLAGDTYEVPRRTFEQAIGN